MTKPRVEDVLYEHVGRLGDRPLLTYYDEQTGERTELSYATFANWTAKTANLLADQEVEPGESVLIATNGHWSGLVVAVACGLVGARVRIAGATGDGDRGPGGPDGPPVLAVAHEHYADVAGSTPVLLVGAGLGGRPTLGTGESFVDEARACDDHYTDPDVDGHHEWLLLPDGTTLTQAEALQPAFELPGRRIMLTTPLEQAMPTAVAVLALGRSLVVMRGADAEARRRVFETERCTDALP